MYVRWLTWLVRLKRNAAFVLVRGIISFLPLQRVVSFELAPLLSFLPAQIEHSLWQHQLHGPLQFLPELKKKKSVAVLCEFSRQFFFCLVCRLACKKNNKTKTIARNKICLFRQWLIQRVLLQGRVAMLSTKLCCVKLMVAGWLASNGSLSSPTVLHTWGRKTWS